MMNAMLPGVGFMGEYTEITIVLGEMCDVVDRVMCSADVVKHFKYREIHCRKASQASVTQTQYSVEHALVPYPVKHRVRLKI